MINMKKRRGMKKLPPNVSLLCRRWWRSNVQCRWRQSRVLFQMKKIYFFSRAAGWISSPRYLTRHVVARHMELRASPEIVATSNILKVIQSKIFWSWWNHWECISSSCWHQPWHDRVPGDRGEASANQQSDVKFRKYDTVFLWKEDLKLKPKSTTSFNLKVVWISIQKVYV